jgi:hypothetical protein
MKPLLAIWWRAFQIVTCTALNVVQVSGGHYYMAFGTGGLLSFIWWTNTRTAAHSDVAGARFAYAFGAACGTMFGMFLGRLYGHH